MLQNLRKFRALIHRSYSQQNKEIRGEALNYRTLWRRETSLYTWRCTQKLLARLKLDAKALKATEAVPPTTALGDWYAHLLIVQRQHLVIVVNERSRLCILTTAKDIARLPQRFEEALFSTLQSAGIPEEALLQERSAMAEAHYSVTTGTPNGRSVLGSIRDYTTPLEYGDFTERTLEEWNLYFTNWICGPLGYGHPKDVAKEWLLKAYGQEHQSS